MARVVNYSSFIFTFNPSVIFSRYVHSQLVSIIRLPTISKVWVSLFYILYFIFYILYFIFYILYFIFYILYFIFYILYFIFYILYFIFYILYFIFYILYFIFYILYFIFYILYFIFYILYFIFYYRQAILRLLLGHQVIFIQAFGAANTTTKYCHRCSVCLRP